MSSRSRSLVAGFKGNGTDDDSGGGLDAALEIEPPVSGTYREIAASLKGEGTATLRVRIVEPPTVHVVASDALTIKGEIAPNDRTTNVPLGPNEILTLPCKHVFPARGGQAIRHHDVEHPDRQLPGDSGSLEEAACSRRRRRRRSRCVHGIARRSGRHPFGDRRIAARIRALRAARAPAQRPRHVDRRAPQGVDDERRKGSQLHHSAQQQQEATSTRRRTAVASLYGSPSMEFFLTKIPGSVIRVGELVAEPRRRPRIREAAGCGGAVAGTRWR